MGFFRQFEDLWVAAVPKQFAQPADFRVAGPFDSWLSGRDALGFPVQGPQPDATTQTSSERQKARYIDKEVFLFPFACASRCCFSRSCSRHPTGACWPSATHSKITAYYC